MPDTGAPHFLPYPSPTDLVRNAPEAFEDLADAVAVGLTDAAAVKQVVYFTGGSSQSTTSTSFINTNITASITPSSVTSKILIFYSADSITSGGDNRSATAAIFTPNNAGTNLGQGATRPRSAQSESSPLAIVAVHSPGVTTSVAYMVCLKINISDQAASLAVPNQLILVEVDV
jgi:hypothetical protein